ncbi:motility associated factor glycosyltransferase family protein [Anaerocolumna sp.]|uniref:motility associated factor glycosyltransferase family protein n=1 Tax=Anaerocolumna sp. TaxID=2041569 RepID=UPI0028A7F6E3|nr:6-hydroxymethylpterin diphosphokinase MptE-like protein [Anaerocolumna sp.]
MTYYEKNIECIKKNRRYMYSCLKDMDTATTFEQAEDVNSVITRDGEQAVIVKYKGTEYRLNSLYRPIEEANRWAEQFSFNNYNNIISMFGFGNGIFARAIIKKMGEKDTFLIYEPCPDVFFHVLNNYDITDILSNTQISIAIDKINEFEFHNVLRGTMDITNMSEQIMCIYPQYDKIFSEICIEFWKEIKDAYIHTKTNVNTEIVFGKRFIENTLNNIKYIGKSNTILELKEDMPADMPAIVVAAGPSVEKQIDEIKRAKGKTVIFAVDRILEYLLDSGVEPDFVVTVDPMKPVKYFSSRTDVKIPLMCFMESNYEILDRHVGKKIICNCNRFLDKIYLDTKKTPPRTRSSASVATVAFTACIALGFERIILVGQDLAYNGGNSHAGGVKEEYNSEREVMIEDIHGNQVKSRYDWKEFVIWYQDMLTVCPNLKVIDAKEEGAKIKGTIIMTLKEAIDTYCDENSNFSLNIDEKATTFSEKEMVFIKKYLKDNLNVLNEMEEKAQDAIEACNILIKETKKSKTETYTAKDSFKKLSKINNYILEQPINSLIDQYVTAVAAQQLVGIYQFSDDIRENNIKTYEKSKNVFKAIIESVDYIRPILEKAIDEVI